MDDVNQNPPADPQDPNAQPAAQTQPDPLQQLTQGFQARINELTSGQKQLAEQLQSAQQQNMQLIAEIVQRQMAPAAEPVQVDEDFRRQADAVVSPQMKQLQQQVTQMQQMLLQTQVQQATAGVPDPEIRDLASRAIVAWQQQGKTGWNVDDAVAWATGRVLTARAANNQQAGAQRTAFNNAGGDLLTGQRTVAQGPAPKGYLNNPSALDALDVDQQLAVLSKELDGQTF